MSNGLHWQVLVKKKKSAYWDCYLEKTMKKTSQPGKPQKTKTKQKRHKKQKQKSHKKQKQNKTGISTETHVPTKYNVHRNKVITGSMLQL